ncbi:MAG TPA: M17 family peptidase N-terminal domain-containing protein, partial [Alphaproteobacteria bacterium]|nr:M17 family peptidase N-terminal domain-containing protein [Alphaproteobacteria bacterium]
MDIRLLFANLREIETECLVVFALDHGDKQKNEPKLSPADEALEKAVAELVSSGELTGKVAEAVLLHRPQGVKAKRLLVIGCGKAKSFNNAEIRKAAGTAVRFLKSKMIKSGAIALPQISSPAEDAVRAITEGSLVADFDP